LARIFGISRSARNPNLCNRCNTHVEEGQLAEITVLFADLTSFTEITHALGPDLGFEIANAFLQMSTHELVKRGAFIDNYIGDAVMAIFNVSLPVADHAARAVDAAVEILAETEKLGARFGKGLTAGVGIASGWARVGSLGSDIERHLTAVGDVVNLASRLESKTQPGYR
jgi:adenylate cyclase